MIRKSQLFVIFSLLVLFILPFSRANENQLGIISQKELRKEVSPQSVNQDVSDSISVNLSKNIQMPEIARHEIIRRKKLLQEVEKLYEEALDFHSSGNFELALERTQRALNILPRGEFANEYRRQGEIFLTNLNLDLVDKHLREELFDEAEKSINEVLRKNPKHKIASLKLQKLKNLKKSRSNRKLTNEEFAKNKEISKILQKAFRSYAIGNYEQAIKEFEQVLALDSYNLEAVKGLKSSLKMKSKSYQRAYEVSRSELLNKVDKAWSVRDADRKPKVGNEQLLPLANKERANFILYKLKSIVIPVIDFDSVSLQDAVEFLRQRSFELDDSRPSERGINFVIQGQSNQSEVRQLKLRNVPLSVALGYICEQVGMQYKVGKFAVTLLPNDINEKDMFSRSFVVAPDFVSQLGGGGNKNQEDSDFGNPFSKKSSSSSGSNQSILTLLKNQGVTFPEGATAVYNRSTSNLIVRNTPSNLDLIEVLVESMRQVPRQVRIQTKFIEITQNNDEELGLDWLLTPFDSEGKYFTSGASNSRRAAIEIDGLNTDSLQTITGGLRSGEFAKGTDSVQSLLLNPDRDVQDREVAPGILGLTGIFGKEQVQVILRGISQKQGADVLTAPSITAKSGEEANISVVREFIYPSEYNEPQIPNETGSSSTDGGGGEVVTPAHPTEFKTRNLGVSLKVQPNLGSDNQTINLKFTPEVTEFDGFINYGSAIRSPGGVELTKNRIEQPVFTTRKLNTDVTIYDGHTIAVGGLIKETVNSTNDKVPIFSDVPLLGNLFKSKTDNRIKTNLMIFVTADIIDPTGNPLRDGASSPVDDLISE